MKKTPLYDDHVKLGAKIVDFAGYLMPVSYDTIINEHICVREKVGIFDVSHMGEIIVSGINAFDFMQYVIANNMDKLYDGKVLYTPLCNEQGGVVDDILIYQKNKTEYFLVVNAANVNKVYNWLSSNISDKFKDVIVSNVSDNFAMLALQGPLSLKLMTKMGFHVSDLKNYTFKSMHYLNSNIIISRTGYTGENGYEIFLPPFLVKDIWTQFLSLGSNEGIMPIGLGARDTLRMEVAFSLYGHELKDDISPLEADIAWAVDLHKGYFLGANALKNNQLKRKLIGFELIGRGIPRDGYNVFFNNKIIGFVTSGSYMPYLKKNLGLALIDINYVDIGQEIDIDIRGRNVKAITVKKPFYMPYGRRK